MRGLFGGIILVVWTGCAFAQSVSVPFVGCKSDGQLGPLDAPGGRSETVAIGRDAAQALAYYKAENGVGVLAPRGWHCFGTYGSAGDSLYVSPQPIESSKIFSEGPGFSGPGIQVSYLFGETSGRFAVAAIVARVFPAYKSYAVEVMKDASESFAFSPYPKDRLTYKSKTIVEYRTPAFAEGLGTRSWLPKNENPIDGVAMLVGDTPDLVLVSIRLPSDLTEFTSTIIRQVELQSQ